MAATTALRLSFWIFVRQPPSANHRHTLYKAMYSVFLTALNVSCNWRTVNVVSVVLCLGMEPNCMSSMRTCRRKFSATLSRNFMTWSSNLRPPLFLCSRATHFPLRSDTICSPVRMICVLGGICNEITWQRSLQIWNTWIEQIEHIHVL